MIVATDVHYRSEDAVASVVLADDWSAGTARTELTMRVPGIAPYQSGAFYQRELPALLAVLSRIELAPGTTIIVDGYVWLGEDREGLGAHLWRALGETLPVVGLAKSHFHGAPAVELRRGRSRRPLFVTAAGMLAVDAATRVAAMHGTHRLPTLVVRADQLARGLAATAAGAAGDSR
jgi:deoxyribonuclease V